MLIQIERIAAELDVIRKDYPVDAYVYKMNNGKVRISCKSVGDAIRVANNLGLRGIVVGSSGFSELEVVSIRNNWKGD